MGVLNSLVHADMYTCYLISSFGPKYQKYLWWKKHLTEMQLLRMCIRIYIRILHIEAHVLSSKTVDRSALYMHMLGEYDVLYIYKILYIYRNKFHPEQNKLIAFITHLTISSTPTTRYRNHDVHHRIDLSVYSER